MHLLDTDICIYFMNGHGDPGALDRIEQHIRDGQCATTAVTAAELFFGAANSGRPQANNMRVHQFLGFVPVLPFDRREAEEFARIKHYLVQRGTPIGPMDLLIAATVRTGGHTLVTNNVREFERVPGLAIENWVGT